MSLINKLYDYYRDKMMKKLITFLFAILALLLASSTAKANNTQVTCLAKAMYFEARGGKPTEQINVGNAILNRTEHDKFPKTICKVVSDRKHAIQFPWYYDGSSVRDYKTYKQIEKRAQDLYSTYVAGSRTDTTNGAVFFHAKTINPRWSYRKVSVNDSLHRYYKT